MASIIRSLVSMVSKEEGDSISEDEQPQVEEATSLDRQTNDNGTPTNDDTPKPKSKKKKDKATKKAEKKAMKKAQKKAAKRLEKEERKRLKKEERKRLKKEARKLEKKKLSADNGGSDMDVDDNIDNSIDETNSAISTANVSSPSTTTTTYITTSNTNQNQILQLIPNHIKTNFRTIGFSKWGGNGSNKGKEKGCWLPILELGPFDVEEGPVRDCWFELAEQAQETGRSMSRLIFWYGVKFEDRAQAYSFVSESKVISYEQGKLQGCNILPPKIANKLKKKQHLTKIEEQIHRGLREVELDVKKDKADRGLLWLTTNNKQVYKVGTRVLKKFFDEEIGKIRPFAGTIERYDAKKKVYHILYEDGDTDMLYELEVKEILAKGGDKKLPAAKTIQVYDVGVKVSKSFFDEELGEIRPFAGSVVSFDARKKYYKVVYEDGDAEDLWASDIKDILVKAPTKRSSTKRKAKEQEEEFEVAETTSGRWAGSVRKKKRRRNGNGDYVHVYLCKEEGCTNHSKQGGVCLKHGAKLNSMKPTCKHVGCNKYPRRGGFCVSHGGSRS